MALLGKGEFQGHVVVLTFDVHVCFGNSEYVPPRDPNGQEIKWQDTTIGISCRMRVSFFSLWN